MNDSPKEISRLFAVEVANWKLVSSGEDERGFHWEMWHNENGRMVMPPKFGESVDSLIPFMPKHINIGNSAGKWVVNIEMPRNEVVSGVHDNMASAIAIALINQERVDWI